MATTTANLLCFLVLVSGATGAVLAVPVLDSIKQLAERFWEEMRPDKLALGSRDPDIKRNVQEIIESRGYLSEEHDVTTEDGYILTIQRIVNPLVAPSYRNKMKPVILQHGLMSSAADFVINSVNVRPAKYPPTEDSPTSVRREASAVAEPTEELELELSDESLVSASSAEEVTNGATNDTTDDNLAQPTSGAASGEGAAVEPEGDTQERPNSLGFYLANRGYDVWLANSRGNIYGQRHVNMSAWNLKFWDFTFDEQIAYDLPAVIEHVQRATNKTKVGYVGHSQGTVMGFGLLSERPEYADIIEPFVAFAPVAYCDHTISPVKYFAVYARIWSHVNLWFASSNMATKYLAPLVCTPKMIRKRICANILFLSVGFDEDELDDSRVAAYLNHTPSGTSVKNVAHYGQEVLSGRFAHFDYGLLGNMYKYGSPSPPSYDLSKIRSKSIALFSATNDWLAAPEDLAHLVADLKVPVYDHFNVTTVIPKWNHIDYVYGKHAGSVINTRVEQIMDAFRDDNDH